MSIDKTWRDLIQGFAHYFYRKSEFLRTGGTTAAAYKPVVLDAEGFLDASMLKDSDIDHTGIGSIGTNTHAQIDTHIAATAAHGATGAVVGTTNTQTLSGKTLSRLVLEDGGTLTIASGVITVTHSRHSVDTESSAASDDLDTISGGVDGQWLVLRTVNNGRDTVVKHGTGNISLAGSADLTLATTGHRLVLMYRSTGDTWNELSRKVP